MTKTADSDRIRPVAYAALAVFACLIYHDTFTHEFSYDDFGAVSRNEWIRDFSNITALFSPGRYFLVSGETSYRPMVTLVYFLEAAVFGSSPAGYHAVNVLLHGICGILTAWMGLRLGLSRHWSLTAAALFIAHPVATEAVNAVGFLEDILALLFLQVSLCFMFSSRGRVGPSVCSAVVYFLALLSKEVSLLFPVAVWLLARREGWDRRRQAVWVGMYLAVACLYGLLRFKMFVDPLEAVWFPKDARLPFLPTLYTVGTVFLNYIRLFFVPVGLSVTHSVQIQGQLSWNVALTFAVLGGFVYLFARSRWFPVRWGGIWCLLFFLPVAQVVPVPQYSAERFLYVPLFGAALAFVAAWESQFGRIRVVGRWMPAAMIVLLALTTLARNPVWMTHETLFQDAIRKNPENPFGLNALGAHAFERSRYRDAEAFFRRALSLQPNHYHYRNNLANVYFATKHYAEAIEILERLAEEQPLDGNVHLKLAWCYHWTGQAEKALAEATLTRQAGLYSPQDIHSLEDLERIIHSAGGP